MSCLSTSQETSSAPARSHAGKPGLLESDGGKLPHLFVLEMFVDLGVSIAPCPSELIDPYISRRLKQHESIAASTKQY